MSNKTAHPALPSANGSPSGMRSEIHLKWKKFSAVEIAGFKDKDDLVAQLQSKYSLDKQHAQPEVDAFAKGRKL